MRFSIYTSIRVLTLGFLVLSAVSVAVGRMSANPVETLKVDHRQPWTVAQHVIDPVHGRNLILQPGADRRIDPRFGEGESVDLLAVSPFADPTGQREMVGRQRSVRGEGSESVPVRIAMGRFRYPDGKLIESRVTDWMPSSQPAWDVRLDQGLRTVFSTGAGFLVRLDWTDERGLPVSHKGERIEWAVEPPLGDSTSIGEPVWVPDPQYQDRLIVNFWGQDSETSEYHVGLAWVELNRSRTQIVDFGILVERNLGFMKNSISIRSPSARLDERGGLHVLWMERRDGIRSWTLYRSELEIRSRAVHAKAGKWAMGQATEVASNCLPVPAYLDRNSRYAYFVVPKSASCYDGGEWRKTYVGEPRADLALRHATSGGIVFEMTSRH
ncbi:hypothetical protein GC170_11710 [bacterium]|nr:hypothetical protein [bacterium]